MYIEKLRPFIYRKSARQRIILYLTALGYSFDQLTRMTKKNLEDIDISHDEDLLTAKYQVLSTMREGCLVFTYPGGRKMSEHDFFRILNRASMVVLGRPITVDEFRRYVNTSFP